MHDIQSHRLNQPFNRHRDAHATAYAKGGDPAAKFLIVQNVQQRHHHTRAAAAHGMSQCNRSAALIELLEIEFQFLRAGECLSGERFVDFHGGNLA